MKIVGILVVTYNRKNKLIENLECLTSLSKTKGYDYKIYVVDNHSTDGTYEILMARDDIEYIRLEKNIGGAGGFYRGIKKCMDDGMDFVWGMDDDAFPQKDALQKILSQYIKNPQNCYWSNCNKDVDGFINGIKKTNVWMFVGFFLDAEKIKKVGYPRSDFFIYHDDAEYAYRLQKNGYKIYKIKDSIISHKDSFENNIETKYVGKKQLCYFSIPNWKCYYLIRNELLMWNYMEREFWSVLYKHIKYAIVVLLFNPKQEITAVKAILHGVFRISGIKMMP